MFMYQNFYNGEQKKRQLVDLVPYCKSDTVTNLSFIYSGHGPLDTDQSKSCFILGPRPKILKKFISV